MMMNAQALILSKEQRREIHPHISPADEFLCKNSQKNATNAKTTTKFSRKSLTKKLSFGFRKSKKSKKDTTSITDNKEQSVLSVDVLHHALHLVENNVDGDDDDVRNSTSSTSDQQPLPPPDISSAKPISTSKKHVTFAPSDTNKYIDNPYSFENDDYDLPSIWWSLNDYKATSACAELVVQRANPQLFQQFKALHNICATASDKKNTTTNHLTLSERQREAARQLFNDEYRGLEQDVCPKLKVLRYRYHGSMQRTILYKNRSCGSISQETQHAIFAKRSQEWSQPSRLLALLAAEFDRHEVVTMGWRKEEMNL